MRKYYYIIFDIIAIAVIIYIGVDTFYRVVRTELIPVDISGIGSRDISVDKQAEISRLIDYQTIIDRNLFSKVSGVPAKNADIDSQDLQSTSMKIALVGTIYSNDQNSAAVIEDKVKKTQGLYREGDSILNAVVKSISAGSVVLRVGDHDEVLTMDKPESSDTVIATAGSVLTASVNAQAALASTAFTERKISIKREDIDKSFENINDLISQATIQPHYTDGEADGLTVTGIKPGSIFRKMGLRNGDIVKGVNDSEIKTAEDLISMYNDLKSDSNVSLQIIRRGQERSLNYSFID
ncbi:MAG TPA: type II secretion system protein GspC [Desulfatiglandales bacterium]|nr:type II secretion system protein GspC [Desulfatiglandales bacterium]